MKKIIRLTESDLTRIVKRVIQENIDAPIKNVIDVKTGEMVGTYQYGVGFVPNEIGMEMGYDEDPTSIPNGTHFEKSSFSPREPQQRVSPREYGNRFRD